MTSLYLSAG